MASRLTEARKALITALRNWPKLKGVFKWQLYHANVNDNTAVSPSDQHDVPTALQDFPAIRVRPAANRAAAWFTNTMIKNDYVIEVTMWFTYDQIDEAEDAMEESIKAVYEYVDNHPTRTDPIVRRYTKGEAEIVNLRVAYPYVEQLGQRVIQYTFGVSLPIAFQRNT